ncbi:MAG TPA: hypothetical protein VF151_09130, partial [Gemmatimonadales bacterium]
HGNDFTEFFFMTPEGEQQPFDPELTSEIGWFAPDAAAQHIGGGCQRDLDVLASAVAAYEAKLARHW